MMVDTLSIARDLRAAEPPPEQAEAIAAAIGRSISEASATKADLEIVRTALKADIDQLRSSVDAKIEQVRTEIERARNQLMITFVSTQVALAGIIIAVIKL